MSAVHVGSGKKGKSKGAVDRDAASPAMATLKTAASKKRKLANDRSSSSAASSLTAISLIAPNSPGTWI